MTIRTRNIEDAAITAAKIASNAITSAKLSTTMATGFIPLQLGDARAIISSTFGVIAVGGANTVGSGGILGSDGTGASGIAFQRVNGATDKQSRIVWDTGSVIPAQWAFVTPPDLDASAVVTVKMLAAMAVGTDTPTIAVAWFENGVGVYAGDTNAGGNTAAVTGTAVAVYSRAIAAADVAPAPTAVSVELTPGTHNTANDDVHLYGLWVEYTRA